MEITPGKANRARVNRSPVPRARDVLGVLRTVLFAPEDLALVKGDPSERRRFLDELLVLRAPRFAGVRADYDRVLKQRNALLKTAGASVRAGRGDLRTLEVWDAHLAAAGAELLGGAARAASTRCGRSSTRPTRRWPTPARPSGPAAIDYRSSLGPDTPLVADRELLAAALPTSWPPMRQQELDRGISLVGPHRDDLVLKLGPLPGQGLRQPRRVLVVRPGAAAGGLRPAARDDDSGGEPVLVLDDVFAELDTGRRERLAELVAGAEQVLVTAAVPADVPEALAGARVDVMGGEVRRVTVTATEETASPWTPASRYGR